MSHTLLAFDFGTKSIGVAIGQQITGSARPLTAIKARDGIPDWQLIERLLKEWQPISWWLACRSTWMAPNNR